MPKFDIETLKIIAKEYHRRFYREFVSKFKDDISLEVAIKLVVNIDDENFKYIEYNEEIKYDYYQIIKEVGIFYSVYESESEFYKDFFGPYFF